MFVIRETEHPKADLKRNWSSVIGGFSDGDLQNFKNDMPAGYDGEEEFAAAWARKWCEDAESAPEVRYHPAYQGFVELHYEGLGAFELEAETLENALTEAQNFDAGLACTTDEGDGHFFASECISYHEVPGSKGRLWVFELKD